MHFSTCDPNSGVGGCYFIFVYQRTTTETTERYTYVGVQIVDKVPAISLLMPVSSGRLVGWLCCDRPKLHSFRQTVAFATEVIIWIYNLFKYFFSFPRFVASRTIATLMDLFEFYDMLNTLSESLSNHIRR